MTEQNEIHVCDSLIRIVQLLESIERVTVEANENNKEALGIVRAAEERRIEQTREHPEKQATDAEVVRFAKVVAVRHRQYEIASHLRRLERLLSDANPVPVEQPERKVPQVMDMDAVYAIIGGGDFYRTQDLFGRLDMAGLGIYRTAEIDALAKGVGK